MRVLDDKLIGVVGRALLSDHSQRERARSLRLLATLRFAAFFAMVFVIAPDASVLVRAVIVLFLVHAALEILGSHAAVKNPPPIASDRLTASVFRENARWVRVGTMTLSIAMLALAVVWMGMSFAFPEFIRTGTLFLLQAAGFGLLCLFWYVTSLPPSPEPSVSP